MAKKRHLTQYDSSGNQNEIYLNTDEVKVGEGKFLDEKLSEMDDNIEAAGQVNEIIMNGEHYTPTDKVIDLGTVTGEKGDKGDKGDTGEQGPKGDKGDPGAPGADGQDGQDGQDGADGAPGAPGADGEDGADGKSAYQSYYDTTSDNPKMTEAEWAAAVLRSAYRSYLATTSDNPKMTEAQWVASLKGEKGDQGDTVVLDTEGLPLFKVINDLTTGGGEDALSAEMGVVIRREVNSLYESVNRLYGKLAAMAFWSAEDQAAAAPTPMNWNLPKVSVAITNSIGAGAVIKDGNGNEVSNSLQLDKGDELVLTVEALSEDYEISNLAVTVDGVAAALVNGTLTIEHVNANTAIVFSGTSTQVWFTANKSNMVVGRTINAQNGLETDGLYGNGAEVVMSPKGPNSIAGNNSVSPGNAPQHFHDVGGAAKITLKFIDPRVTTPNAQDGLSYQAEIAQYTSSYGFISRGGYVWVPTTQPEVGGLCDAEFSLASNAKYVKILFFQRVRVTAEHIDANTYFSSLPSDFLKYKLD